MIVFYDDGCGLCQRSVLFFLKRDKKKQFLFAPLSGKRAHQELQGFERPDSLIVIDNNKILYYSRAVFRLLWELGGVWKTIGVLSFLPTWLLFPFDLGYRLIARLRRGVCLLPQDTTLVEKYKDRFVE